MSEFLKYPEEIQKIFLFEQKRQTGKEDVSVFVKDYAASKANGGFTWTVTLYSTLSKNNDLFRSTVSFIDRTIHSFEEMIEFYKREVPDIFQPETQVIEIDGETFII